MRRRVDDGWVQLEAGRRLLRQKQGLVAHGEAVLVQHCHASWLFPHQLQHQQQYQYQQQCLLGQGQPVHSSSTVDGSGVAVHSLEAACAAGQWWLRAVVSLPLQPEQQQAWAGMPSSSSSSGGSSLSLLAVSDGCRLACSQQQCMPLGSRSRRDASEAVPQQPALVQLTAALHMLPPFQQQLGQRLGQQREQSALACDVSVEVFLLAEPAPGSSSGSSSSLSSLAASCGPAAMPPVPLGRLQLRWQEWLHSHGRPHASAAAQASAPAAVPWEQQQLELQQQRTQQPLQELRHCRVLAASLQLPGFSLDCLHEVLQQQLGLQPVPAGSAVTAAGASAAAGAADVASCGNRWATAPAQTYVLPAAPDHHSRLQHQQQHPQHQQAEPALAAVVMVVPCGSDFADVQLRASSAQLLDGLQQRLEASLQATAAQPAGGAAARGGSDGSGSASAVALRPSLLSAQHAQQQAAAMDATVQDLTASIEWVEALLQEKRALESHWRQQKQAPDPATIHQRQAASLAAMVASGASIAALG